MYKILHITPHMGGGVGNVISRLSTAEDNRITHKIILLEEPLNNHFVDVAKNGGVNVIVKPNKIEVCNALENCDIIIIHWWHHPKTTKFLYDFPLIPVRLIIWTHISNLTVPALAPELLLEAARVLFTTDASYNAETFCAIDREILAQKTGVVPGSGGLDRFPRTMRKPHDGFNIGYLGLVDFSKIHPDFISFCKAVNIPEANFILAGDAPAKEILDKQAGEKGITKPFIYLGYVTDVPGTLAEFDVLGYPLMPFHTGTTENAILEAMAAEIPPVLLNQLVEKNIIEDKKTGLLVSSAEEYGNAMRFLYENPGKRREMGRKARKHIINKYSVKNILDEFNKNCEIAMKDSKKIMRFKKILGNTPAKWFISSLGKDIPAFLTSLNAGAGCQTEEIKQSILKCSPILKCPNKSSIFHYEREFQNDPMLKLWANMVREKVNSAE